MLTVLATGTLVRPAQRRQSAKGHEFVTFLLRVPVDGDEPILASCIAFHRDVVEAVLALGARDTIAVSGSAKLTRWEKNGEEHRGISITVDLVMTAYEAGKRRKQREKAAG